MEIKKTVSMYPYPYQRSYPAHSVATLLHRNVVMVSSKGPRPSARGDGETPHKSFLERAERKFQATRYQDTGVEREIVLAEWGRKADNSLFHSILRNKTGWSLVPRRCLLLFFFFRRRRFSKGEVQQVNRHRVQAQAPPGWAGEMTGRDRTVGNIQ